MRLPRGFRAGATRAGIKPSGRPDLALLVSGLPAAWAYAATQNRAAAPSIHRGRALYASGKPLRAVVVNAGNANCATGERGYEDDRRMAELAALRLGLSPEEVLTASTGVIGVPLPVEKIARGLPEIGLTPSPRPSPRPSSPRTPAPRWPRPRWRGPGSWASPREAA